MAIIYINILRKPTGDQYLGNAVMHVDGAELFRFKTIEDKKWAIKPGHYALVYGTDALSKQFYDDHFQIVNDDPHLYISMNAIDGTDGNIKVGKAFLDLEGNNEWTTTAGYSTMGAIMDLVDGDNEIVLEISTLP